MTIITGGTVSVEDCKKHDGYPDPQFAPTRKVRVELIFVVPEGSKDSTAFLDQCAALANAKVAALLGAKPGTLAASVTQVTERTPAEIAAADALKHASAGTPPKPATPPKKAPATTAKPKDKPAPMVEEDPLADPLAEAAEEDDLAGLLGDETEVVVEITDADLNTAVRKKNEALKKPTAIRALIEGYGADGKKIQLREIPADKRADFLKKLEALS